MKPIAADFFKLRKEFILILSTTIKIIKTPFLANWGNAGGAIAIYTKDGEDTEEENH